MTAKAEKQDLAEIHNPAPAKALPASAVQKQMQGHLFKEAVIRCGKDVIQDDL